MDLVRVFGACGEPYMFWLVVRKFRIFCVLLKEKENV
jgi:hypothetical protein